MGRRFILAQLGHASLDTTRHHFLEIPIAQRIGQVPTNAGQDHRRLEVVAL